MTLNKPQLLKVIFDIKQGRGDPALIDALYKPD